jgi:hypothetical protein
MIPPLVTTILYFPFALGCTLLPLVFRSKTHNILYWLLWVVLIGASIYCTYIVFVLHAFDEMFGNKVKVAE